MEFFDIRQQKYVLILEQILCFHKRLLVPFLYNFLVPYVCLILAGDKSRVTFIASCKIPCGN